MLANPCLAIIMVDAATDTLAVCAGDLQAAAPVADLARIILAGSPGPATRKD
jgi:hypothetical protein